MPHGRRDGDLHQALLAAAAALLEEGGIEAVSVREAARRVGVSPRAPYRHFPDKESLLSAMAADAFAELGQRLEEADTAASAGCEVEAQALAYVRFAQDAPARFRLMFGPRSNDKTSALAAAKKAAFAVSERRVKALCGPEVDVEARVLGYWAFARGLAELCLDSYLAGAFGSDEDFIRRVTRATLIALNPIGSSGS